MSEEAGAHELARDYGVPYYALQRLLRLHQIPWSRTQGNKRFYNQEQQQHIAGLVEHYCLSPRRAILLQRQEEQARWLRLWEHLDRLETKVDRLRVKLDWFYQQVEAPRNSA